MTEQETNSTESPDEEDLIIEHNSESEDNNSEYELFDDMGRKAKDRPIVVCASLYGDPLHSGHVEYLKLSKALGDMLIVIVNNDVQAKLKKGKVFMECRDRLTVISELKCVDMAVKSVDHDRTVCKSLSILRPDIFTNGGDQFNDGIPEAEICKKLGIKLVDGLGAKIQSSSSIIKRAKEMPDYKAK